MTDVKKPKKIKMIIEESDEPPEPVKKELDDISDKLKTLQDLSTQSTVNMTDILNLHNTINTNIEKIERRVEKIKTEFNNTKHKPIKEIEPELYQKYIDEINSLSGEIDADTDIEELITSYKTATYKINLCENFLKSKQMNIVYCDNDVYDEE